MNNMNRSAFVGAAAMYAVVLTAVFAAASPLEPCRSGEMRPAGHLAEFLRRQVTGTTGRHREIGYPFDGCMWSGIITNVYF